MLAQIWLTDTYTNVQSHLNTLPELSQIRRSRLSIPRPTFVAYLSTSVS